MSQHRLYMLLPVFGAALLQACGSTYSLREFSAAEGEPKTALIDIKQRAIVSSRVSKERVATCAEPSPDAMSSMVSELAVDAKYKDLLTATLGFSQQEAASFVGLRTQTIQLLRDGMYRLCEGYLSGALTPADFAWQSRRYQKYMVALLTIEQLTRVAQVPAIAHAGQGMASAARSATAIQAELEQIDKQLKELTDAKGKLDTQKAEADALPATDSTKATKVDDIKRQSDTNAASIARAQELRTALLEGLKNAKGALVGGNTSVQIDTGANTSQAATGAAVAEAIAGITHEVLNQDDLGTMCFQVAEGSRKGTGDITTLQAKCAELLGIRLDQERAKSKRWEVLNNALEAAFKADPKLVLRVAGPSAGVASGGTNVKEYGPDTTNMLNLPTTGLKGWTQDFLKNWNPTGVYIGRQKSPEPIPGLRVPGVPTPGRATPG